MTVPDPAVIERERRLIQRRAEGLTFRAIAEEEGIAHQTARDIIERGLTRTLVPASEEVRRVELATTQVLFERAFEIVHNGTDLRALQAIDRCVSLMERKAKMLGLDAPVRTEVITLDALDSEIRRLEAEIDERARREDAERIRDVAPEEVRVT